MGLSLRQINFTIAFALSCMQMSSFGVPCRRSYPEVCGVMTLPPRAAIMLSRKLDSDHSETPVGEKRDDVVAKISV